MEEQKKWESPKIEELDINETAWTSRSGKEPDMYYLNCDPLYYS